ncbi:MAG: carbamoyltransferase HypF [Elusimicrobia bacterium GWA2_61_42]|nr:MAG: carbamoyltransferase HypF [Elusimicrobia bacterium GWA2_61_42]OGR74807.1 MAG: carbamoyltransferase HypF [Elusimicrobia bacterium GWC2_61_25]
MASLVRKKILVKGVVQGVGFRPHVYKLAVAHALAGWVKNDAAGVTIEAEGRLSSVKTFIREITLKKPAAARVDSVFVSAVAAAGEKNFCIAKSGGKAAASAIIPADLALCPDCRRELLEPSDRRYVYPFTNCTNCGPRFTIVKSVPYDRPATTMAGFKMCPDCLAEYGDPLDRRFHAQPNACPVCGPSVSLEWAGRSLTGLPALEQTATLLLSGRIGALQSLGGFHLACRADSPAAVKKLRAAKKRPHKPFAVMVSSLAAARLICSVSRLEAGALSSPEAPVMMLRKLAPGSFPGAAPALSKLGVMLPYTPLHAALFRLLEKKGFTGALLMTSGNFRDEPICKDRAEVKARLSGAASFSLFHDRPIHNRVDDSVAYEAAGGLRLARRARGFVPAGIKLASAGAPVLACGADLKNAFCLTRGGEAFLSQHIGDLSEPRNQAFFKETLANFRRLLKVSPAVAAHDLHPDYASSALARALPGKKTAVQHHAAHALSVAAEHGLETPFIGLSFDGTGYGTDGKIWGSEFMVFKDRTWRRAAHLDYFPLPGGDAGALETWRPALALVRNAFGPAWRGPAGRIFSGVPAAKSRTVERMIEAGLNCPATSSLGRLFDAFSFLSGIRGETTYEAQGPMELESVYGPAGAAYSFDVKKVPGGYLVDPAPAVRAAVRDRLAGRPAALISAGVHKGLAAMAVETACRLSKDTGIKTFCLSGGVFQNRTLLELVTTGLERRGCGVYANRLVPANDGGLALGQAWYVLKGYRQAE